MRAISASLAEVWLCGRIAVSMQVREIEGEKCVILPSGKTNEASCIFSCGVTVLGDPDCSVALC